MTEQNEDASCARSERHSRLAFVIAFSQIAATAKHLGLALLARGGTITASGINVISPGYTN